MHISFICNKIDLVKTHRNYGETLRFAKLMTELVDIHPLVACLVAKQALTDATAECVKQALQSKVSFGAVKSTQKNPAPVMSFKDMLKAKKIAVSPAMWVCRAVQTVDEEFYSNGWKRLGCGLTVESMREECRDYVNEVALANAELVAEYDAYAVANKAVMA